jgi:hypothetical protein
MRVISFAVAFSVAFLGLSTADPGETTKPGIGTFTFSGARAGAQPMVVLAVLR